jgi:hypothetical protein
VLREGQVVDARVVSKRSARGVILATVEYTGMAEGREVACVAEVSLGYLRSSPKIGEQINVSVRAGPCARPVSRAALQWPWIFVGFTVLMLAGAIKAALNLLRYAIPSHLGLKSADTGRATTRPSLPGQDAPAQE